MKTPENSTTNPTRNPALADAPVSASLVIVYTGKHYGQVHRVTKTDQSWLQVIHEPSGDTLTVPLCDVEEATQNAERSHAGTKP